LFFYNYLYFIEISIILILKTTFKENENIPWSITPQITKAQTALIKMFDSLPNDHSAKFYIKKKIVVGILSH